jgi:hypothetical protein
MTPHDPGYDPENPVHRADPLIESMVQLGQPVTRENYIGHYLAGDPDPDREWTWDDEMNMPAFLRTKSDSLER